MLSGWLNVMSIDLYSHTPAEKLYVHHKQIFIFTLREDPFGVPERPVFTLTLVPSFKWG